MLEGRKNRERVDWAKLESPNLDMRKRRYYGLKQFKSCGTSAISMVTGLTVNTIDKHNNNSADWAWDDTERFLTARGYTCTEVTKKGICDTWWQNHNLTEDHILWCCCRMGTHQGVADYSAVVIHRGAIWHNFERIIDPLFFLNKPTEYVVVISHEKYSRV